MALQGHDQRRRPGTIALLLMQRLGTHGTPAAAAVRGLWRDCYSDDVRGGGRSPTAAAAARGPGAAARLLQRRRKGWGPQPAYCSSGASMTALDLPLNTFMDIVINFDCVMIIFGKFFGVLYYCPILERTVFAVGAMVTDAVNKGADKQIVIKFKQRAYNSWSQAREAYSVSRSANVSSVRNQVFVAAEDIEDDENPFQLKCKVCKRNFQLNNQSKWKKEHNCKVIAPKGVRSGPVAALPSAHFGCVRLCCYRRKHCSHMSYCAG